MKLFCKNDKSDADFTIEENEIETFESTVNVRRPIYTEPNFEKKYQRKNDYKGFQVGEEIKTEFKRHFGHGKNSVKKMIYNRMPCVKWLKDYRVREYLLADLLAGLTVGIMHVCRFERLVLLNFLH